MIVRAVSGIALCLVLAACGDRANTSSPQSHSFNGIDLSSVPWGRDFRLADTRGASHSIADYRGKVVLLYFGYLNCPDMCPTTLAQMAQVRARMGADRDRVQGLFVTVDPQRDKPAALAQYVAAFDPTFVGLRGDPASTAAAASEFKVFFKAQKADPQGNYTVDHSGGIYVFDAHGRLRLMLRPGESIDAMAADVGQLVREPA
jgi:protein SCO1